MNAVMFSSALLAAFLAGWEIILILAVVLILFGARKLPELTRAAGKRNEEELVRAIQALRDAVVLWLAQGFGAGRVPLAPGTFGSLLGLLWFAMLLGLGELWLFVAGILMGLALSVWLCGAGERILKQSDPGSIVLDEITAVPVCFVPSVVSEWHRHGAMPSAELFFNSHTWLPTAVVFVLFRLFDIAKPWPIRQSQRLPGGWGVTADDVLAALYVALITLFFVRGRGVCLAHALR